jgi:hypothetical protein
VNLGQSLLKRELLVTRNGALQNGQVCAAATPRDKSGSKQGVNLNDTHKHQTHVSRAVTGPCTGKLVPEGYGGVASAGTVMDRAGLRHAAALHRADGCSTGVLYH